VSTGIFRLTEGESSRCEDVRLAMGEVLDGLADSTTRGAVEAHVRICLPCSREMEELKAVIDRLREIATVTPGPAAWK
jgi:anti-sigma factor RsiW